MGNGSGTSRTRLSRTCRWRSRRRSTATATLPGATSRPDGRSPSELEAAPLLARADALAERWAIGPRERRTDGVLTEREVEVLRLVAEGMTNGQIGVKLFMSPKTASVHVSHILAKLGAANRTEAAATARRQGLLG